nr:MAG TPA: hypothetical protein [Caudoviricetes sp.]
MAEEFSKVWSGLNKANLTPPRVKVRGNRVRNLYKNMS